ncbi:MAG: DUF1343 domain-containing protein [Candidatus Marinimicrobia bacterium]|nr:DUF1343 domain-containing protein [Candidatus Neomarinimicrobiota bacterium]
MNKKVIFRGQISFLGIAFLLFISSCTQTPVSSLPEPLIQSIHVEDSSVRPVRSGLEVFLDRPLGIESLKYGLLTNQTCVNRELIHGVELLPARIDLQLILSPEHGLFGAENAGDRVDSETDPGTGIKALSTYRKKPAEIAELISDLDVVLFDIQDIGVRSYTYIYSMAYLMQAAAIAGKKVIILDRPNPINGVQMEGNILDPDYSSFVGMYPIPYRHGMTTGELALLFNSEYGINCDLEIVAMEGWTRNMWFEDTGLPWVPTSPHVPDAETILPMIATGTYGELGMLSEGVGTTIPFEYTGGPWITDPHEFARVMEVRAGEGVIYRPTFFKPYYGRHKGEVCGGLQLYVTDRDLFSPYLIGLMLMSVHQELYPEINLFENTNRFGMFDKVMGSDEIRQEIQKGTDPKGLEEKWMVELLRFGELRKKYLLYQ